MPPSLLQGATLLLIDDNSLNLDILSDFLAEFGAQSILANSGLEGLRKARQLQPDLIVLDIMMPQMDGYTVCINLKDDPLTRHIPVIFASALSETVDKVHGFELGAVDYLSKPFELVEVRLRLENHLSLLRARQELEAANAKLLQLVSHDALTGIANRRRFDEALSVEWRRAVREQTPLALIMTDIDLFKHYNDRFGHPAGDRCLQAVVRTMNACLKRPADLLCRYGGEEFAVILPNTHSQGAYYLACELQEAVQGLALEHPDSPHQYITLSLGVSAQVPSRQEQAVLFLQAADQALYQAKESGRNAVKYREPHGL